VLCFALRSGKRSVGALQLMSRRADAINDDGLAILHALGDELALALQNAVTFDRLSTMTVTDTLTGLHNRRFCEEFVRKQLMGAQRAQRGCGFLLIDIDDFKPFNERFGQAAGDAVLRGIASALLRSVRAADLAGRYGGEEFIVVLPNADLNTSVAVAERIRINTRELPLDVGDDTQRVTVSIGASSFPECASTLAQLFNSADVALYAAKEAGRDRVTTAPLLARPAE
jgi:diguanylate cyclase (GGDEF)-like protein